MKENKTFLKFLVLPLAAFLLASPLFAREPIDPSGSDSVEVIDIPTADVVDHYGYHLSFRFASEGDIQTKAYFGVFPRLNIGFGLDGEHIIGTDTARLNKPTINVKFKPYDGNGIIPAIALGFDGQGYDYNRTTDEYNQREKGFYTVVTWPVVIPEFKWHLGFNIFDFDEDNSIRGFSGLTYTYRKTLGLLFEYNNFDYYPERRINYGAQIYITPVFTVDLIGRNVEAEAPDTGRETERVLRLSYTGTF